MAIKKTGFTIKGMTRDTAVSKFSPELAYENKNLRIVATEENTSFGLVNEKGTANTGITVAGTPIGQEIINDSLILFTTGSQGNREVTLNGVVGDTLTLPTLSGALTIVNSESANDHIYKFSLQSNGTLVQDWCYSGDLGFDPGCPIESIGVYEDQQIQKVYWTDGINQPRVVNITASAAVRNTWNNNTFNFVKIAMYNGGITINKNLSSFGSFAPGVIQYCFSYYDLYGPETNIFYTSPLYYVSPSNRGGGPEEVVSCSFTITIPHQYYNNSFDYLRIYSILRTSVDATPQVRRVVDYSIKGSSGDISFTDTGTDGESIDPTELFYVGGEPVFVGTMAQKDNTLFLGDISLGRPILPEEVKDAIENLSVSVADKTLVLPDNVSNVGHYSYTSQLNKSNSAITYYRSGETYRVGLQAQHYTGRWSEAAFITDYKVLRRIANSGNNMILNNLKVTVPQALKQALVNLGYVKIRPVVVFPDANNRDVICQGVLCPTVFNVEDRFANGPYAQSSWFFRPSAPITISATDKATAQLDTNSLTVAPFGKWAEFRHNYPIPGNLEPNAEIQCLSTPPPKPVLGIVNNAYSESTVPEEWVAQNKECYYVDQSVFTMHSPDVEFSNDLKAFDSTGVNLRIVGMVPIHASYSDIDIEANSPNNYAKGKKDGVYTTGTSVAPGFVKTQVSATDSDPGCGWKSLISGPMWFDELSKKINDNIFEKPVGFIVYPWQRTGTLNGSSDQDSSATSWLKHKKMSIVRFSKNSKMLTAENPWTGNLSGAVKFDSNEVSMVKIPKQKSGLDDIVYYGNIDKIVSHHSTPKGFTLLWDYDPTPLRQSDHQYSSTSAGIKTLPGAYPIAVSQTTFPIVELSNPSAPQLNLTDIYAELQNVRVLTDYSVCFGKQYTYMAQAYEADHTNHILGLRSYIFYDTPTHSNAPVSIKYKSTPHLVMALSASGDDQVVLPTHNNVNGVSTSSYGNTVFWGGTNGVSQGSIPTTTSDGYLWLAELYRTIPAGTRFGGTSDEAKANNKWIPAGEPIGIANPNTGAVTSGSSEVIWDQGDTYYQRYDCLKTFPFTMEDINSVSDTLSFMCETRVNIDGRYDRNRGRLSNLYATPANTNLVNTAYSQTNNFFRYSGINYKKVNSTVFPNTITWTKTKTMGEAVDTWTGITLASTLALDGDKGRIRALRRFNNDLLAFQDRGISQILYNENIQIASTTGVPIEIANSGKVSGKRYISNHIGCVNKWSICSAPTGIYFMDDIGKDIFLFNGQLNNISDKFGFHSWVISNFPNIKVWNPRDFATAGEITYYDKVNGDVLFITGNNALAFSEPLGNFSSFYSYERTPYFGVLADRGILWHPDNSLSSGDTDYGKYKAWWQREGDYNYFYGKYQPFSITVVANEHPTEDKVFNNLEYRGDTFDVGEHEGDYLFLNTFNRLETWNEYQNGIANLEDIKDNPSNLKKKFRIWRANIPRNTTNKGGDATHRFTRDRMRNPWLYIKLSKEQTGNLVEDNNKKSILHDLVVYYYE